MDNFTRMIFPVSAEVVNTILQVPPKKKVEKLLLVVNVEMERETLQQLLEVSDLTERRCITKQPQSCFFGEVDWAACLNLIG